MKYNRSVYQSLTMIGQFGINMLVPVFLCSFLGIYLDRKLETSYFVVILFFIGAAAGGRNCYRFAKKIFDRPSSADAYVHKGRKRVRETGMKEENYEKNS